MKCRTFAGLGNNENPDGYRVIDWEHVQRPSNEPSKTLLPLKARLSLCLLRALLVRAETESGLDPGIAKARETLRFEAAKAVAPYVHARLQTTTLAGDPEKPLTAERPI